MRKESLERFMIKVRQGKNGCVFWAASTNVYGYGQFWVDGRMVKAHRWAYEYFIGPIPPGLQLDHLCRNRNCVNPAHLEPVTCKENLLRGDTLAASQLARTHCPQGHEYAGANLYVQSNGRRQCRTCHADRQRAHQKANERNTQ